jgi:hypothetical protein
VLFCFVFSKLRTFYDRQCTTQAMTQEFTPCAPTPDRAQGATRLAMTI